MEQDESDLKLTVLSRDGLVVRSALKIEHCTEGGSDSESYSTPWINHKRDTLQELCTHLYLEIG